MEIDARTIREVEFREKIRGYNPDDVDDFLEQVAVAFEAMEDRLRNAPASSTAVQAAAPPQVETREIRPSPTVSFPPSERTKPSPEFDPEIIQRTLLLAQKTADETVRVAEDQAESTISEAKAKAESLVNQAMGRASEIVDDAVNQARDEVLELAKSKDRLLAELNHLNSRLASAKDQMKHLLSGMLNQIDGSFAPMIRSTEAPVPQLPEISSPDERTEVLSSSSNESLFNEPPRSNGSGVFDDELE